MSRCTLIFLTALICFSSVFVCSVHGAAAASATTATKASATTAKATTAGSKNTTAPTTVKAATTGAAATTGKPATTGAAATTAKAANTTKPPVVTTAKTTAPPTSTAAKAITTAKTTPTTTEFRPFPKNECHMPFWRGGVWHHTCIKYNDFGDFWCSLTANFTKDENWRRCRSPDLKRFQCHIPFEFNGKNHTSCLPIESGSRRDRSSHHTFWCATVPKINRFSQHGTDWAYCEDQEATGVTYLKAVGPHRSIAAAKVAAAGKRLNGTSAESAAAAAAAGAPGKALNGGAGQQSGSGASGAGLSASATIGIAVGVVCSVLAVAAVVAGVAIRKRRCKGQHKALLQTREKGTYGGMEASD